MSDVGIIEPRPGQRSDVGIMKPRTGQRLRAQVTRKRHFFVSLPNNTLQLRRADDPVMTIQQQLAVHLEVVRATITEVDPANTFRRRTDLFDQFSPHLRFAVPCSPFRSRLLLGNWLSITNLLSGQSDYLFGLRMDHQPRMQQKAAAEAAPQGTQARRFVRGAKVDLRGVTGNQPSARRGLTGLLPMAVVTVCL